MRKAAQLDGRIVGTSSNLEEVRRMIIAGLGIGPLPIHVAAEDVKMGRLWQLPPNDAPPAVDVHLVWNPHQRLNRAEAELLRMLQRRLNELPFTARIYH